MHTTKQEVNEVNSENMGREDHQNTGEHGQISADLDGLGYAESSDEIHQKIVANYDSRFEQNSAGVDKLFGVLWIIQLDVGTVIVDEESVGAIYSKHRNQTKERY